MGVSPIYYITVQNANGRGLEDIALQRSLQAKHSNVALGSMSRASNFLDSSLQKLIDASCNLVSAQVLDTFKVNSNSSQCWMHNDDNLFRIPLLDTCKCDSKGIHPYCYGENTEI